MALPIGKLAPTGAVIGFAGYCLWPLVFSSAEGPEKQSAKLPEIAPAVMSPTIAPVPARDPFRLPEADAKAGNMLAKTAKQRGAKGGTLLTDAKASGTTGGKNAAESKVCTPPKDKEKEKADLLAGMVLKGTSIHGNQSLALINDRVYTQGETLALPGTNATSYQIARILPHKVVLSYQSTLTELSYLDIPAPTTAPTTDGGKPAKAGGAAAAAPGEGRPCLNAKSPPKAKK